MRKPQDLTNKRYGKLIALQRLRPTSAGYLWLCRCDCGNTSEVTAGNLNAEHSTSCGCFKREATRKRFLKHGMTDSPEYKSYLAAKGRCNNVNRPEYADYGGRGIKFLFTSFEQFYAEVGPRPKGCTLDRENNDGNYEPGNVRWQTQKQQVNNTRRKRLENFSEQDLLRELTRRAKAAATEPLIREVITT